MIRLSAFLWVVLLCSCNAAQQGEGEQPMEDQHQLLSDLQAILDSAQVEGAILLYDLQKRTYYSNDFEWSSQGRLPASTFKIPNSIIALETGVVENDSTLFKWDGEERGLKVWEQDLIFRQAFQFSCVPCYQEVARKIGSERMNQYLTKLRYGDMKVDSSNIDIFWLEGASTINQYQQIDFLKSLYQSELPIRNHTEETIKRMMILDQSEKYRLRGKTGWSIRNGNNNGWFVGYLETENEVYFIAVNINPGKAFDMNLFPMIRKAVAMRTFQLLKIIE